MTLRDLFISLRLYRCTVHRQCCKYDHIKYLYYNCTQLVNWSQLTNASNGLQKAKLTESCCTVVHYDYFVESDLVSHLCSITIQ